MNKLFNNIYLSHKKGALESKYHLIEEALLPFCNSVYFPHAGKVRNSIEVYKEYNTDLILAEVSEPATGQGIELGWANMLNIPIICLYKNNMQIPHKEPYKAKPYSSSLKEVSSQFIFYEEDILKIDFEFHLPLLKELQ
jgi:hypothetical protein